MSLKKTVLNDLANAGALDAKAILREREAQPTRVVDTESYRKTPQTALLEDWSKIGGDLGRALGKAFSRVRR